MPRSPTWGDTSKEAATASKLTPEVVAMLRAIVELPQLQPVQGILTHLKYANEVDNASTPSWNDTCERAEKAWRRSQQLEGKQNKYLEDITGLKDRLTKCRAGPRGVH